MGYLIVPDIHKESVVCQGKCSHTDCASMRREWGQAKCQHCGQPLKAGTPFYYKGEEHQCVDCAFKEADLRRPNR